MQRHPVHLAKVTRFDAVQRSEQWKRRIDKEERLCFGTSDALSTARTATPTSMVRMPMDAQSPIRVQRPAGASFSTGSGFASAAPQSCHAGEEVPSARHYAAAGEQQTDRYGDAGAGVLRSRSSSRRGPPSVVSLGSARSSVLSRAGLRTTRSTTTLDSLPTSASNLTAIALQRLDRLEKTLEAERSKRLEAEKQLSDLKVTLATRISGLESSLRTQPPRSVTRSKRPLP